MQDKTVAVVYGGSTLSLTNYGSVTGLIQAQGTGSAASVTDAETASAVTPVFTAEVTGTWNGPLYTYNGAVSRVTVGGTADENGTITDTAANTGVWNIAGTGSDGKALTYAATQPAVAYAAGEGSELDITVRQGGALNGDILIADSAAGTVTNSGTWVGNA